MKKSFKTALCTILGVCLLGAVLTGCAQAGDERANDLNGANDGLNNGMDNAANNGMNNGVRNQGLNRNNLVGGRYGNNNMNGINRNTIGNRTGTATGNTTGNTTGGTGRNTTGLNNRYSTNGANGNGTNTATPGMNGTNALNGNDGQRASMIERQLENVNGIDDCTVLVSGDTALVGLRNNGNNGSADMSRLRTSIERRVKQIDDSIRNVSVTDSGDMLTRMGRLGTGGNNGGMADNFMDEFNNMINSIGNLGRTNK